MSTFVECWRISNEILLDLVQNKRYSRLRENGKKLRSSGIIVVRMRMLDLWIDNQQEKVDVDFMRIDTSIGKFVEL